MNASDKNDTSPEESGSWFANILGEGVIVGSIVAAAYWFAYFTERSYLGYFGIPTDFTYVTIDSSFSRAIYIYLLLALGFWIIRSTPTALRSFAKLCFPSAATLTMALMIFLSSGMNFWVYWFGIAGLIGFLWMVILPFFKFGTLYPKWLKAWDKTETFKIEHVKAEHRSLAATLLFGLFCLVAGQPIGHLAGTVAAAERREFASFIDDGVLWLIVEQDTGSWIAVEFDDLKKGLTGRFKILSQDSIVDKVLIEKKFESKISAAN